MSIDKLLLQADGKVVAAGRFEFTGGGGGLQINLVRFNPDGTFDAGFNPAIDLGFAGVRALAVGAAGQVVVHYWRFTVDEVIYDTVRLLSSGALDPAFDDGTGPTQFADGRDQNATVSALEVQSDGSVLVAGFFDK